jgi:hypothetical protein
MHHGGVTSTGSTAGAMAYDATSSGMLHVQKNCKHFEERRHGLRQRSLSTAYKPNALNNCQRIAEHACCHASMLLANVAWPVFTNACALYKA